MFKSEEFEAEVTNFPDNSQSACCNVVPECFSICAMNAQGNRIYLTGRSRSTAISLLITKFERGIIT